MGNEVRSISLDKLEAHSDNPNEMSKVNFGKLVRNIKRTGLYEPLIVRPKREGKGSFEIINGEHRRRALSELGYKAADCIVWDVDDEETDILLLTLNRLGGRDGLDKKLKLLRRLKGRMKFSEAAKFLPARAKQIEGLVNLKRPSAAVKADAKKFAEALVFFVSEEQKKTIEKAITLAVKGQAKAARRAGALSYIAEYFVNRLKMNEGI